MKKKILLLTVFIILLSTGCSTLLKEIGIIGEDITITYITNSETVISPIETKNNIGYILEKPIAPQKKGYIFDGWYSDSQFTKSFSFSKRITEDTTLYAKWIKIPIVTFVTDCQTQIENQTAKYESPGPGVPLVFEIEKPITLTKKGYFFDGWYSDSQFTKSFSFSKRITEDTTLYAKWIKIPIVTFVTDCQTQIENQTAKYESPGPGVPLVFEIEKPITLTKKGYFFDGWYSDSQFTKSFSFSKRITEDTTLYAKWGKIPVATYITNSDIVIKPQEAYYNGIYTEFKWIKFYFNEPDSIKRDGYIFDGWYSDSQFTKSFSFSKRITEDTTLYAKWYKIPIVTFITNSDTIIEPTESQLEYSWNMNFKIDEPVSPTKKGYNFDGWYSDSNFTNSFNFDNYIKEDITLYAKWIKVPTISFVTNSETKIETQNGRTVNTYNLKKYKGEEPNIPIKKGYIFNGWYSDSNFTNSFNFDNYIKEDITLYAKWIKLPIATFVTNSKSSIKSQKAIIDKTTNKAYFNKPISPTKEGYIFDGWFTDSNFTNLFIFENEIDKDTTFYAKWVDSKNSKWIIDSEKDKFGDDTGEHLALYKNNISGNFVDTYKKEINIQFKLSYDINNGLKFIFLNKDFLFNINQYLINSQYLPVVVEYKTEKTKGGTMVFLVIDEQNNLSIISNFYSPILNLSNADLFYLMTHNMRPLETILYENTEMHIFFTINDIGTIEIPKLENESFYSVLYKLGIIE